MSDRLLGLIGAAIYRVSSRRSLLQLGASRLGESQISVSELIDVFPRELTSRIVFRPRSIVAADLPVLLASGLVANRFVQRAQLSAVRADPIAAKNALLTLLLQGVRSPAVELLPEVSASLNQTDASLVLAMLRAEALQPTDPYTIGPTLAARAIAAVLAQYPSLVDTFLASSSATPASASAAADIIVLAISRSGLLRYDRIPDIAAALGVTPDELSTRLRPADNRYSTSDKFDSATRPAPTRRTTIANTQIRAAARSFGARLVALLAVDASSVLLGAQLFSSSAATPPPAEPTLTDAVALVGVLVAMHVLAVQLAAAVLPPGVVSQIAWPARLVSAYAVAAILVTDALFHIGPIGLADAAAVLFVCHMPFVARDLVAKADLRRAARRIGRDRQLDAISAGRLAGQYLGRRQGVRSAVRDASYVRSPTTEPVRRRRVPVTATREGYADLYGYDIARLDAMLGSSRESPYTTGKRPPGVALMTEPGKSVATGDIVAIVEADEPEDFVRPLRELKSVLRVRPLGVVDRTRDGASTLAEILNRQASLDAVGADSTSSHAAALLEAFLREGSVQVPPDLDGYLENVLPFSPEMEVVQRFESLWRRAIEDSDEGEQEVLRNNVLRLVRRLSGFRGSAIADFLVVRVGVVGRDASDGGMSACAALLAELAGIVAESGHRASFFPARSAVEDLLKLLANRPTIPREEELVRQRFEELLARGIVADYFLETNVERGCRTLVAMSRSATGNRKTRIGLGLAKIGALALDEGRLTLATRLAFLVRDSGLDYTDARRLLASGTYGLRMTTLSGLAGELFGANVGTAISRYLEWSERLHVVYPSPATVSPA